MVDSITPAGQATNILSVGKAQKFEDNTKHPEASKDPVDELKLSPMAQSISDAQKQTNDAYKALQALPDVTLSSNTERLNQLV